MDTLTRATQRMKRGIMMADKAKDESAVAELKVTLDALEKQMPQNVSRTYKSNDDYIYGECPNCHHSGLMKNVHKNCWWCGQAIDWRAE
jgi:ribosomal protein S27AE